MRIFLMFIISFILSSSLQIKKLKYDKAVLEQKKAGLKEEIKRVKGNDTFGANKKTGDVSRLEADLKTIEENIKNIESEIGKE